MPRRRAAVATLAVSLLACGQRAAASAAGGVAEAVPEPTPAPVPAPAAARAPAGMIAVAAGPVTLGGDDGPPVARARHEVTLSSFFVDRALATFGDYDACVAGGACPARAGGRHVDAAGPALVTFTQAHAYCLWRGKRLSTEAEWERAATLVERAPGTGEWVHDWASPCFDGCARACGPACRGLDPAGPCDGAPTCPGSRRRLVKGGALARAAQAPDALGKGVAVRCASSTATLTTWPPLALAEPPPPPAAPAPPTARELELFRVGPDTDVLAMEPCFRRGLARLDCRDPMSYLVSNEKSQHLWAPYVTNVGGGYVGVGADQSYSFVAAARSEWVWLFDYDPAVVRVHRILAVLVAASPDPASLLAALERPARRRTRALLRDAVADPDERAAVLEMFDNARGLLERRYGEEAAPSAASPGFGWLRVPADYAYVRTLLAQGRIQVVPGNMLNDRVLPAIAASARALGVTVRVYYPSNAEEQWALTPTYRRNVGLLPFDERSVVLRTLYARRWRNDPSSYWQYVVHGGLDAQRRMALGGYTRIGELMDERSPTPVLRLSVIRLPGRSDAAGARATREAAAATTTTSVQSPP